MKNYTVTVNGNQYQGQVEENVGATPVVKSVVPVATPAKAQTANSGEKGSIKVVSPMPGKILGIKANIGQAVKAGEPIVILEAMKMENEIVAPEDGVVASIEVSNGDAVEVSQVLATLK